MTELRLGSIYKGQVATRSRINTVKSGNKQGNFRSGHFARDRMTSVQIAYANWYSSSAVHEAGSGGTATFSAAIEYPIGSARQPLTWSGASSYVAGDGVTTPLTDALTLAVPIPKGAAFRIWTYTDTAQGVCYNFLDANLYVPSLGDAGEVAASGLANKTISGTITPTAGLTMAPVLIVGDTRNPAVFMAGDSISYGLWDVADINGDVGILARSIGALCAYTLAGVGSETLQGWLTGNTRRLALANSGYFSHVLTNFPSINDVIAGRSSAQMKADAESFAALFNIPVWFSTMQPSSSSTDSWATIANQTANNQALIAAHNANVRAGFAGASGYFEVGDALHSSRDSGKWDVRNGVALTGTDSTGIHPTAEGYLMVANKKVIDPLRFAR